MNPNIDVIVRDIGASHAQSIIGRAYISHDKIWHQHGILNRSVRKRFNWERLVVGTACQLLIAPPDGVSGNPGLALAGSSTGLLFASRSDYYYNDITFDAARIAVSQPSMQPHSVPHAVEPMRRVSDGGDIRERLGRLDVLRNEGIITDKEYEHRRRSILDDL